MDTDEDDWLLDLFKIKKNQMTMIADRGYQSMGLQYLVYKSKKNKQEIVDEWPEGAKSEDPDFLVTISYTDETKVAAMTVDEFRKKYEKVVNEYNSRNSKDLEINFRQSLSQLYIKDDKYLYVYYSRNEGEKSDPVMNVFSHRRLQPALGRNIIIRGLDFPPKDKADVKIYNEEEKNNVQVIQEEMLLYNPTKHYLVPQHSLVENKQEFLERNKNIKRENQLPLIQKISDVICGWYGFPVDGIVRIDGKNIAYNSIITNSVFFRSVVNK